MTYLAQASEHENFGIYAEHQTGLPDRFAGEIFRKRRSKEFHSEENYTILSKIPRSLNELYESFGGTNSVDTYSTRPFSEDIFESGWATIQDAISLAMREVERIESQKKLAELPAPSSYVDCAYTLQEWEATVQSLNDTEIACEISRNKSENDRELLRATIPLEEIDERDRKKARVGARFRWWIGYVRVRGGTTQRVSKFVFRDMPRWSEQDFVRSEQWAERIEENSGRHLPKLD